jgi:hypothetical protein
VLKASGCGVLQSFDSIIKDTGSSRDRSEKNSEVSNSWRLGKLKQSISNQKSTMNKYLRVLLGLTIVGAVCSIAACDSTKQTTTSSASSASSSSKGGAIKVGGIYSYQGGDGSFGILKVLSNQDGMVDTVLYKNRFEKVPETIDPKTLEVAIKHEILSEAGFGEWQAKLLTEQPVTEAETQP